MALHFPTCCNKWENGSFSGSFKKRKEKKIYVLYIHISHYQVLEILKIPKIFCNSNLTGSTSLPGS